MRDYDSSKHFDTPADRLLDELESIKDLLEAEVNADAEAPTDAPLLDVPLLDDPIVDVTPQPTLLDIDSIFKDEIATLSQQTAVAQSIPAFHFPKFTLDTALSDEPPSAPAVAVKTQDRRALLIRELVDELLPQIAATLRERLEHLDTDALQALKRAD